MLCYSYSSMFLCVSVDKIDFYLTLASTSVYCRLLFKSLLAPRPASMSQANSFVERYVAKVRANPWGATFIVLGSLVIALSSFSDAARNLWSLFSKPSPMEARVELNRLSITYSEDSFLGKAKEGDVVAVKLFLAAGMNPDAFGSERNTALCTAAAEGRLEVVDELLENKANVRIGDLPALVCAAYGGASSALLTRLLDADPDPALQQEAIYVAALHGHLEAL